jgi:Concanavalin A-like lectin/glucanases superfamily
MGGKLMIKSFMYYAKQGQGGIDSYTKTMLHMNGADQSTTFTDSELTPKTWTAHGAAKIVTAQSKFSGASGYFDASAATSISTSNSADFNFGSGDFTIDFWVRFAGSGSGGVHTLYYMETDLNNDLELTRTDAGALNFKVYDSYPTISIGITASWSPSNDTWYHVALVRYGTGTNCFVFYVNGSALTTTKTDGAWNATIASYSGPVYIGMRGPTLADDRLNGYLDEYRVSKGIARWTANFTPPTTEYTT